MALKSEFRRILREPAFWLLMSMPLTMMFLIVLVAALQPPATHTFTCIDDQMRTLNGLTIVSATRRESDTLLVLSDGRTISVTGYKGHHFYEVKPITEKQ